MAFRLALQVILMIILASIQPSRTEDQSLSAKLALDDPFSSDNWRRHVIVGATHTSTSDPNVIDVRSVGAQGDGKTDDSGAFETAFRLVNGGGVVFVPPGAYMVGRKIEATSETSLQGAGWASNLLWASDDDLIVWNSPAPRISISNLAITSVGTKKSQNSTALRLGLAPGSGAQRVEIDHVLIYGAPGSPVPNTTLSAVVGGSAIDLGSVSDTSTIRDCILWFFGSGTGIKIGKGSEVRIEGGRIIGGDASSRGKATTISDAIAGAVGIHVTGNNGGVHVVGTDVISLGIGMILDNANGQGSNREIFITHATFDSDGVGILVRDNSYISVAGLWAASSDVAQIWLQPTATGAIVSIAGGTIFNGGTYYGISGGAPCPLAEACHGIIVDAGTFMLTGVAVRDNRGTGILVRAKSETEYSSYFSVTGCQIFSNGVGVNITGGKFAVTGNVAHDNVNSSVISPIGDSSVVASNVGFSAI